MAQSIGVVILGGSLKIMHCFSDEELRAQIVPPELLPSLEFLYERLMLDGDAKENWQAALALHELSEVLDKAP